MNLEHREYKRTKKWVGNTVGPMLRGSKALDKTGDLIQEDEEGI